ncbi:hypothetical protein RBH94_15855 [Aestuariibaculum sp. YM273]|uniref:hypothetical protein n=1 Tax=Aestuariibaculum sp. YM273 TaxID=3070659 RepID=UPI0027DB64D4|nr:hypothetical protein [Aestuariibaculum sp. YM273]WMI65526.1 hypothetical protein RBH94_15855 [Aestuariibaculum sp. YM273]
MTEEQLRALLDALRNTTPEDTAAWIIGGGRTAFEAELDGYSVQLDRRNNADEERLECMVSIDGMESIYVQGSDEFTLISDFLNEV